MLNKLSQTRLSLTDIAIWYMKPAYFREFIGGWKKTPNGFNPMDLEKTHVLLGFIPFPNGKNLLGVEGLSFRDTVYNDMQGEIWSPNGEANTLIEGKGLGHTSMSVGDCMVFGSTVYMVANCGFKTFKL